MRPTAHTKWDGGGLVPPEPKPSIFLYQEQPPGHVAIALKLVMAESMLGLRGRLYYDPDDGVFVSYMKPNGAALPTLGDVVEIWVVNRATGGES